MFIEMLPNLASKNRLKDKGGIKPLNDG